MHDAQRLLSHVDALYSLLVVARAALHSRAVLRKADIERARLSLMESWPQLLPDEREHAVDILLRAACEVAGTGTCVDWDVMKFTAICNETGYYRFDISRLKEDFLDEHDELVRQVDEIVGIYALDRHHEAGAAKAHRASQWAASFLSIAGLPLVKYVRLSDEERTYVSHVVGHISRTLRESVRADTPAPPVQGFLLSAEDILMSAFAATQTTEDRFHTFGLLLDLLPSLYTARIPQLHADPTVFAREAEIVDSAVLAGEGTVALQHFEALSVDQQLHIVHDARYAIAEACEQLAQHGTLPDASRLTHRIFEPLTRPPPLPFSHATAHKAGTPTARHSYTSYTSPHGGYASLGHGSVRQARRYYARMAREWDTRRATGGV